MSIGTFTTISSLPVVRAYGDAVGLTTSRITYIGGVVSAGTNRVEEYNGSTWTIEGNLLAPNREMAAWGDGSTPIYTAGWYTSYPGPTETNEYNGTSWSDVGADFPTNARNPVAAGAYADAIVGTGRYGTGFTQVRDLCWSWNGTTWTSEADYPVITDAMGGMGTSAAIGSRFTGGAAGFTFYSDVREWSGVAWTTETSHLGTQTYHSLIGGSSEALTVQSARTLFCEYWNGTSWVTMCRNLSDLSRGGGAGTVSTSSIVCGGLVGGSSSSACEEYSHVSSLNLSVINTAVASGTGITLSGGSPPDVSSGDAVTFVIIVKDDDTATTSVSEGGWTLEQGFESLNNIYIEIWSKNAAADPLLSSVTWAGDNEEYIAIWFAVTGADNTSIEVATETTGQSISPETPAFAPSSANRIIYTGYGIDGDNIGTSNLVGGLVHLANLNSGTSAGSCGAALGHFITDSSTTLASAIQVAAASDQWGGFAVSIAGAAGIESALTGELSNVTLGKVLFSPTLESDTITVNLGNLAFSKSGSLPLTGLLISTAEGTVLGATQGATNLAGVDFPVSIGSLGHTESGSAELLGELLAQSLGSIAPSLSGIKALVGQQTNVLQDSIIYEPEENVTLALSGQAMVHITTERIKQKDFSQANVHSLIREETTNTGISETIGLKQVEGFARFSDAFVVEEEVYYVISTGTSTIEIGLGRYMDNNRLRRVQPLSTLVAGVYSTNAPSRVSLSGTSIVSISPNAETLKALYQNAETRAFMLMGSF